MGSQNVHLIPGLPNEIGVICLARISLSCHFCIGAVCRTWRNLFREDYFWAVRREHEICEPLLLVWSRNQYKNGVWHGCYEAAKEWIRLPLMPRANWIKGTAFAVVDEKLFVIGGECKGPEDDGNDDVDALSGSGAPSAMVSYFDFKLYKWKQAAPLNLPRRYCMAGVINNLLYVCGGLTDDLPRGYTSTGEVYSPVNKTWTFVSSMTIPLSGHGSIVVDGKFYAVNGMAEISEWKGLVYDPQNGEWEEMPEELNGGWTDINPVEFNGQICINRDSYDGCSRIDKRSILGYNAKKKTWEFIDGDRVDNVLEVFDIREIYYPRECPAVVMGFYDEGQLLAFGGRLCFFYRNTNVFNEAINFRITDLAGNVITSKVSHPCLFAGIEDRRVRKRDDLDNRWLRREEDHLDILGARRQEEDLDILSVKIECQIVRL